MKGSIVWFSNNQTRPMLQMFQITSVNLGLYLKPLADRIVILIFTCHFARYFKNRDPAEIF